ncbi:MAG: hypothetical protein HKO67_08080 [Flavobacteriaceae bacterium]|nr:hypothetical protein [Flavobacteriaceae bacterium]
MKSQILKLLAILFISAGFAQNGINYKAIIKDNLGNVVANQSITIQFNILEGLGMTNVYSENHTVNTDANGLAIVNIGEGSPLSGNYGTIGWAGDQHFFNVQVDTGSGLVDLGTTEFKAVPYALSSADNPWIKNGSYIYNGTEAVALGFSGPPTGKMEIRHNSGIPDPQLTLYEDQNDYSRLSFANSNGNYFWTIAGYNNPLLDNDRLNFYNSRLGDIVSITGDGKVGIREFNPEQRLDVNGKLRIGDDGLDATEGTMRYDSASGNFEGYNGSDWEQLNNEVCLTKAVVTNLGYMALSYDFSYYQDGRFGITVDFNIRVDTSTVALGSTFTLTGAGGSATGTITFLNGGSRLRFESTNTFLSVAPCFSGGMTLTISGSGGSSVLDLHGNPIDGDLDGMYGGDFVVTFDIVC